MPGHTDIQIQTRRSRVRDSALSSDERNPCAATIGLHRSLLSPPLASFAFTTIRNHRAATVCLRHQATAEPYSSPPPCSAVGSRRRRRATLDAGDGAAAAAPKVVFLFLTNSDLTFASLWERFFAPTPSFCGRFVVAKPTCRADPSLMAASRRLLAVALLDGVANAYFVLLSQHCVPLQSFLQLYATLFPPRAAHHHRLPSYIEVLTGEPQMPARYAARGEGAMLPEVPFDRFRIGSQFFTLARRYAVLVVRERHLWRKFRTPCLPEMKDLCYPEEHYFPTLLDMADDTGCARYTLTRVDWTGTVEGHPHRYTTPEVSPRLIADLRRCDDSTIPYR